MLAGELYDPLDPELLAMRLRARQLTSAYNQSRPDDAPERRRLLDQLFGRLGQRADIEPPFHCDYGRHFFAGDRLFLNLGCVVLDCAEVVIGDNVSFGPYVQVRATTSRPRAGSTDRPRRSRSP